MDDVGRIGWAVCVQHRGRHGLLDGACVAVGREVARRYEYRFGRCGACGVALDYRHDTRTGRVEVLEAGAEVWHVHAPPVLVELDEDRMAAAIVRAAAASRDPRAQEQAAGQPAQDQPAGAWQTTARGRAPLGGVPVLTQSDG